MTGQTSPLNDDVQALTNLIADHLIDTLHHGPQIVGELKDVKAKDPDRILVTMEDGRTFTVTVTEEPGGR